MAVRFRGRGRGVLGTQRGIDLRAILAALPQVVLEQGDLLLEVGEEVWSGS
jgi:aconitase B